MRAARTWKPAASRLASTLPAFPDATASGLMIARVSMRRSGPQEFADDVPASEETDQRPVAGHGEAVHVLGDHQRGDVGDRLPLVETEDRLLHHVADPE